MRGAFIYQLMRLKKAVALSIGLTHCDCYINHCNFNQQDAYDTTVVLLNKKVPDAISRLVIE